MGTVRVALTGGIGTGKSEVARLLASYGALVVDADVLAREVVAPGTSGFAEVVAEFGPEVLDPEGGIDRTALGRVVFADDERRRALEAIVHPRVAQRSADLLAAAPTGSVVVYEVPLLVETGAHERGYDAVVVVDADDEVRLARLERRGLPRQDALARIAAQADRATRLAAADHVVDNSGSRTALESQVRALWATLRELSTPGRA